MKLWLDTIDFNVIKHAEKLGILAGVTTNPSILGKAQENIECLLKKILDIQSGYLAVQVISDDFSGQIIQARKIAKISNRIVIKIPAIGDGFLTIKKLNNENIKTLATNIFESRQIVMAGIVGANFAAPYINRMEKINGNAFLEVLKAKKILDTYGYDTVIMAASIKSSEQFMRCAEIGIGAVTLPLETYYEIFESTKDIDNSICEFKNNFKSNSFTFYSDLFN